MARDADRDRPREETRAERPPDERREPRPGFVGWLASTVLQTAVAIVGLAAVLYALSMAFGVNLFDRVAEALATQTGQWLAIALVVLFLTGAAIRAMSYARTTY